MGCIQSNKVSPKKVELQKPPEPTVVSADPRLPLTTRQVFRLKQSWKGIRRNLESTGVEMFVRLLDSDERIKNMFGKFKDLKVDDLRTDPDFEAHGLLVMGALDEIVTVLDKVDDVYRIINRHGASHKLLPGFTEEFFWFMEKPFLDSVQLTLGDRYTEQMEEIYRMAIKFLLGCFEKSVLGTLS